MTEWRTSTFCSLGDCVRVKFCRCGHVHVGDSKDPDGPVLTFTYAEWRAHVAGVKRGEFDLPDEETA